MCSLLWAKGFTSVPPDWHILVLVPRFDRDLVMTFHGYGSIRGKNGARFKINFVFNEG